MDIIMADYHISKRGDDWRVQRAGGDKASAVVGTKAEALKAAAGLATRSGGGEVREHASRDGSIHKRGQIIDSDTHGKPDPKGKG